MKIFINVSMKIKSCMDKYRYQIMSKVITNYAIHELCSVLTSSMLHWAERRIFQA